MTRTLMKSKIHRVKVTHTNIDYNGSITIDQSLCSRADLLEHEKVDIYNVNTGARFSTYVLYGPRGVIGVNGAAARLVQKGDLLIIVSYAQYNEDECRGHKPVVICMQKSTPARTGHTEELLWDMTDRHVQPILHQSDQERPDISALSGKKLNR